MRYYDAISKLLDTEIVTEDEYTASDVLSKLTTVDGAASGLDADLLDGNHAAAFTLTSDARLSDARTPTTHSHSGNKLAQANTHESADTDSATTALHHTIGTGASQVCAGNDSRLSDARTPTSHTHTGVYQPTDPDLTAIAALTGTGYAQRTGDGTWTLSTPSGSGGSFNFSGSGYDSVAIGYTCTAGGSTAISFGYHASATGDNSINMGLFSTASGGDSVNIGSWSTASGNRAINLGLYGTASGFASINIGSNSIASGSGAISFGYSGTANGDDSISIGSFASANTANAITIGKSGTASGNNSINIGASGTASGIDSTNLGYSGITSGDYSTNICANGNAHINGMSVLSKQQGKSCQKSVINGFIGTTNATPKQVTINGEAPNSGNSYILSNNQLWYATIHIVALSDNGTNCAAYTRQLLIKRGANAASVALVGSVAIVGTDVGSNSGAPPTGYAISFDVDTSLGALKVIVTGASGNTLLWSMFADLIEVGY